MSTTTKEMDNYQLGIHRLGRITSAIIVIALVAVPLVMTIKSGIKIDIGTTVKGFIGIFSLMGILTFVEFFSYAPLLGAGGLYLSFITGNTINMKLPAAMSSVKLAGVEQGSKEAEVISLIAVAVSSLVTVVILTLGMIGMSFLLPIMQSPQLQPAFANLMPALLGALATPMFFKDKTAIKAASVPSLIAMAISLGIGFAAFAQMTSLAMPIFMAIAVAWRYVLYKSDLKKAEKA
jgi:hypothetical protein